MRNLKRALSLALASVMLLGMMVVGTSAASYPDVDENDNVEAIEVLNAVNVMIGRQGNFEPDEAVNRHEMAVIMAKLVLGVDTADNYVGSHPFTDVVPWADKYVAACYENGLVAGTSATTYGGSAPLSAVQAAAMMLRALGYKDLSVGATDWRAPVTAAANQIRLFNGVASNPNEKLNRNQVAQLALNTLKSPMVNLIDGTFDITNGEGQIIITGGSREYKVISSREAYAYAINRVESDGNSASGINGATVELGEHLYNGKLKLNNDANDAFGRPARYWEYDGKEIGTYIKDEILRQEYTVKVTGKTLYDLLGSAAIKDYDLDVYIDGVDDPAINPDVFDARSLVRTNDAGVGATGKGVLTQVFVDPSDGKGHITIAIINTYLALADEDYDDRTDDVDITVYGIDEVSNTKEYVKNADNDDGSSAGQNEGFTLEVEDFPSITTTKKDDAFLVQVAQGDIQTIAEPETMSKAQISSFSVGNWIVSGGTQYDFASAAEYECETLYAWTEKGNSVTNLKEIEYNIYLDQYGYAIGVKEVERVNNYVFITGVDTNAINRYAVQADATGIFLDGTMESMKLDMRAVRDLNDDNATLKALNNGTEGGSLVNKWFTYSVGSDGVYDVVVVGDSSKIDANKARAAQFRTLTTSDAHIGTAPAYDALGSNSGVDTVEGPKSIALRGTYASNSPWYSVYGDDQSVYITVELTTIQDANDDMVNVISGVEDVAVGIDNADIEVWTKAEAMAQDLGAVAGTAYGTYTLFDKDGDVIAAVVVGEDAGSVTNLVYTHKGMNSETDNNANDTRANASKGTYTWTRYVVSNGEETLLTEVGTGLSELKKMEKNTWYVVKYNAKGEVKNVYPAWAYTGKGLIDANAKDLLKDPKRLDDRYVNNIEELNQATNENRTVLYEVGSYNNVTDLRRGNVSMMTTKPSVDNHTFYLNTATTESLHQGFRVSDDVKTVFIQTNNNKEDTTYESGYSKLEKLVGQLHDHDEKTGYVGYRYEISAVMDNGKAVVVVIRDLNNAGAVIGKPTGKYEVRFQPGFWSDERNVFYVGVNKLDNSDFYNYNSSYDAFRVSADTNDVQVVRKNATDEEFGTAYEDLVIGEYDNAALGYVIGHVDRSGRVLSFTVEGNCTLYSPLKFWTAPTVTPDSSAAGFTPEDAKIPQPIGSTTYPMWIRDAAHKAGPLPKAVGEASTEFVKGNYYTVTVEVDKVEQKFENVLCEYNGFLLINVKLSVADLIVEKNNINVVLTSVVDGEKTEPGATEFQVTVPAGVTVTYKADGKPVTTGKVAKGTVIVVEPSTNAEKVVKVNGDAITEKTEVTVDKAITITLEDVKAGEVILTVNLDAGVTKVNVKTATVTKDLTANGTVTVKKGETATLTVTLADKKVIDKVTGATGSGTTYTTAALNAATTVSITTKDEGTKDADVKAIYNKTTKAYTFGALNPAGIELTDDQILQAIADQAGVTKDKVQPVGEAGQFTQVLVGTELRTFTRIGAGSSSNLVTLYPVTINGDTQNISNLNQFVFSGLTADITLLPVKANGDDSVTGSGNVTVTKQTDGSGTILSTAVTEACEYKTAYKYAAALTGITNGVTGATLVWKNPVSGEWDATAVAADDYITAGTEVAVKIASSAAASAKAYKKFFVVTVNGTAQAVEQAAGSGDIILKSVTINGAAADGKVLVELSKPKVKLSVNGAEQPNGMNGEYFEATNTFNVGSGNFVLGGAGAIGAKVTGSYAIDIAKDETTANSGDGALDGVITLSSAAEVVNATTTDFKVFTDAACTTAKEVGAVGKQYVGLSGAEGTLEVYIQAPAAMTMLKPKAGSAHTLTLVTAPSATEKGVWKTTVSAAKGIAEDEFAAGLTIALGAGTGFDDTNFATTGLYTLKFGESGDTAAAVALTVTNLGDNVIGDAVWTSATPDNLAAYKPTTAKTSSAVTITVPVTTEAGATAMVDDLRGVLQVVVKDKDGNTLMTLNIPVVTDNAAQS